MRTLLLILLLGACDQIEVSRPILNTQTPTAITATQGWEMIAEGLEYQQFLGEDTLLRAIRINPAQYTFRVHYRAGEPLTISEWQSTLPEAEVIINANFFTPEYTVLGLLISDGIQFEESYINRGGTFFVHDNSVGLSSNILQPYHGQNYQQAIQAFPMLMIDGVASYQNTSDLTPSRRTVIALDQNGYVIMMTTPGFGIGLYTLSQYLPTLDIGLVNVLNLDGGGSTMMYIAANESYVRSFDPVPSVLAVYRS